MSPAETESGSATIAPAAQHGSQLLPIGFLGAYITLSTMAMDGVRLLDQGRPGLAVGYRVATLLVGQMAEVWGRSLGPLRWLGGEMQLNREAMLLRI